MGTVFIFWSYLVLVLVGIHSNPQVPSYLQNKFPQLYGGNKSTGGLHPGIKSSVKTNVKTSVKTNVKNPVKTNVKNPVKSSVKNHVKTDRYQNPNYPPKSFTVDEKYVSHIPFTDIRNAHTTTPASAYATPVPAATLVKSCLTWAGTHYKTFDGRIYSFDGTCRRFLVKNAVDNSFAVAVDGITCTKLMGCHRPVIIYYEGNEYILTKSDDGRVVLKENNQNIDLPVALPDFRVHVSSGFVNVTFKTLDVSLAWDEQMLIEIQLGVGMWKKTAGLCGTLDGNPDDDTSVISSRQISHDVVTFVNNWKTSGKCSDEPVMICPCNIVLKETVFEDSPNSCKSFLQKHVSAKCNDKGLAGCQQNILQQKDLPYKEISLYLPWRRLFNTACLVQCEGNPCPEGTVLHENNCIHLEECPCQFNGIWMPPNSVTTKQCNTCQCRNGSWNCTQDYCPARCSIIGDPHYITFDGKSYDFMGHCSYYLVKTDDLSIIAENVACAGAISVAMNYPASVSDKLPTCTKMITIHFQRNTIKLEQNQEVVVNGNKLKDLPYSFRGVTIKSISSVFLVVSLSNEVEIWWDGVSRAYIDAPISLIGKTKGLCGTFNYNQTDDFHTPDDDIEQSAVAFANKWKTKESCRNEKELNHPCDQNEQKKTIAENYCRKLKLEIFSECHLRMDPEQYYRDCLYDMCSCEMNIPDCLCPILAAFAAECARQGTVVDWRSEIRECGMQCFGGQTYKSCTNPCTRSCRNIAIDPNCKKQCLEGCSCDEGYTLNDINECIPIHECKCYKNGMEFEPNSKEIVRTTHGAELCTCINASWTCKPATNEDITKFAIESHTKNSCDASANMEFTNCEPVEQKTCKNMHSFVETPPLICHAGCKCKQGYVLDTYTKRCVHPSECACHHGGKNYPDKSLIKIDCNVCKCSKTKWKCTSNECAAECSVWGNSHFKTFDGKLFDFQGNCDYILSEGKLENIGQFRITTQNVPCGSLGTTCSKSLTISISQGSAKEKLILVEGRPLLEHSSLKHMTIRWKGDFVIVEAPDLGFRIRWDNGTRIYFKLDSRWRNKVQGLCSNYNNNNLDDFQTPSNSIEASAQIFGDSWRVQQYCAKATEIYDTCQKRPDRQEWAEEKCDILKSSIFAPCHSLVPYREYFKNCIFDSCACDEGDCECYCTAIAAYAQECANKGVDIKWRTRKFCPMQCELPHTDYRSCTSSCPIETCENTLTLSKFAKACKDDSCIEACEPEPCPDDQIYLNSSYEQCVPRNICKPVCMVYNDKYILEGEMVTEDECHKCHCSRGQMICRGKPCTSGKLVSKIVTPSFQLFNCVPGWTRWINQDKHLQTKSGVKTKRKKLTEIEPVPTPLLMARLRGSKCSKNEITDIECRTVGSHIFANATGLDLICDLSDGLMCRGSFTKGCPDFEIRVKCTCDLTTQQSSYEAHETDCHKYYHYSLDLNGQVLKTERSCGEKLYNPKSMVCDWSYNVIKIRPECQENSLQPEKPRKDDVKKKCPNGLVHSDCAIDCHRLCLYYSYFMIENGICDGHTKCIEGCINPEIYQDCPPGMFWLNNATCVAKQDCLCISHSGKPVRPGTVYKESDCEVCQCIDNYYTCDTSSCQPTVSPQNFETEDYFNHDHTPLPTIPHVVTPPRKCREGSYVKLIDGNRPLPDSAFSASSTLGPSFAPENARMTEKIGYISAGCWSPSDLDQQQYLQIDLGKLEPIYGIIIQGSPIYDEYVTSYTLMYSTNGRNFVYVLNKDKRPQIFRGPVEKNMPMEEIFHQPFEARIIRINPQTWHRLISMKVELIGCAHDEDSQKETTVPSLDTWSQETCEDEMGLSDGRLPEEQVSVSSELLLGNKKNLKLTSTDAWQPLTNSIYEYIQFDFMEPRKITGYKIRGGINGWVSLLAVKHSQNGFDWSTLLDKDYAEKLLLGNFDQFSLVITKFPLPINARYLKLIPKKWHKNIQMKVEILGCFKPYPQLPTPSSPVKQVNSSCLICNGIEPPHLELNACECPLPLYWNGKTCVQKTHCPCVVGHISYDVGSLFEREDCSQCICALGGIAHCSPKVCQCPEGLRKVVTDTCACTCQPCPDGQILCPTCNICIDNELWCNGIEDCSDDEINCSPDDLVKPEAVPTTKEPDEILCKPGFEQTSIRVNSSNMMKYLNKISPMYKHTFTKTSSIENSKNVQKHTYKASKLPRPPTSYNVDKEEWFDVCKPIKPPPKFITTSKECPSDVCAEGFFTYVKEIHLEDKQCPNFFCIREVEPDSICEIIGKTVTTFDGTLYKFDICNHVLVRDLQNGNWEISLSKTCTDTCLSDLTIRHEDHLFTLHSNSSMHFDGYLYNIDHVKEIGMHFKAFQIFVNGENLLFISNLHGFWILWSDYGNIKIGVFYKLAGKVDGLCGYFNHNPEDDKTKPGGKLAKSTAEFGESWALGDVRCIAPVCSDIIQNEAWYMCNKVKDIALSECVRVVDIELFMSYCIESTCECLQGAQNHTSKDACRCEVLESFVSSCKLADPNIELPDWRLKLDCSATCEHPFVYQDCYPRKCELTCDSVSNPEMCPKLSNICFPGCYCPPGTVRKGDSCIKPSSCKDCECNVLPHLQYVTYDGNNVTVTGSCVFTMSRDLLMNRYDEHKFQVLVTNAPCHNNPAKMCVGKMTILYKGHKIFILLDETKQNLMMIIDRERVNDISKLPEWMELTVTPAKHFKVHLIDVQIEVSVYFPSLGTSIKAPSQLYAGKLEGLCGDCNKNYKDDFLLPSGELTEDKDEFALSWLYENLPGGQTKEQCENKPEICNEIPIDEDPCVQLVDINIFGQCHPVLDPLLFIDWCKNDICDGVLEHACTSIEAYARECGRLGFCINWRTSLCPAKTCLPGFEYDPCGPNCPRTCETIKGHEDKECKNVTVEGCFCPKGKVLLGDKCVPEKECIICDEEGHHPGDVWKKDKCTTCHCEGTSVICNKIQCSGSNDICEKGYVPVTIPAGPDECCNKFSCVPEPTMGPTCETPMKLDCGPGQILKLDKKPNGCSQFICECKPASECEPPLPIAAEALENGYHAVLDTSGCCPTYILVCEPQLCAPPPVCPQYHSLSNKTVVGKCCPLYSCEPPKNKCIYETKYTNSERGGERLRTKYEKQELLKNPGETWNDGPCRECRCLLSSNNIYEVICSLKTCPSIESSRDFSSYLLSEEHIVGECCPKITRVACRSGSEIYDVGQQWIVNNDYCAIYKCVKLTTGQIAKETQVITCDTNCSLGYEYKSPEPGSQECCGSCQPVACVVGNTLYKPGDKWFSKNKCIQYMCTNFRGSLQIRSMLFNCPRISDYLLENFVFKKTDDPNTCCKKYEMIACKDNGKIYKVGETWIENEGNKCRQTTCFKKKNGELGKREYVETCMTSCPMGWEYKKFNNTCCGKCEPAGCLVDGELRKLNDVWGQDECSEARCEILNNQYAVVYQQESCPILNDCPAENIIKRGCCKYCNSSTVTETLCVAESIPISKTIGIFEINHTVHGTCINMFPIDNLNECKGTCHSSTLFNKEIITFNSVCSCCRPTEFRTIDVQIQCEDGYKFIKKVKSPVRCGCNSCSGAKSKQFGIKH